MRKEGPSSPNCSLYSTNGGAASRFGRQQSHPAGNTPLSDMMHFYFNLRTVEFQPDSRPLTESGTGVRLPNSTHLPAVFPRHLARVTPARIAPNAAPNITEWQGSNFRFGCKTLSNQYEELLGSQPKSLRRARVRPAFAHRFAHSTVPEISEEDHGSGFAL